MPPQPSEDWSERSRDLSQLLARAGMGDRAAFAALYEKSSPHLFAVVLRICRDRALAEDILQEVYVNVWRAASGFDAAQSQPLTWLTSIARNRAIDSLRRAQTQPQLQTSTTGPEDEDSDVYDDMADEAPGPLELLSRADAAIRGRSKATAVEVTATRGSVFAVRSERWTLAVVTGRLVLSSLMLFDLRHVLDDLDPPRG